MAAKYSAAGTAIVFNTTYLVEATSIEFKDGGNALDVTTTVDTTKAYIAGVPDPECTVECEGQCNTAAVVGSSGTLAITKASNPTISLGFSALLTDRSISIGNDGKLTTSYTFKPLAA